MPGGKFVGLIAEVIVLGCIACGIAANSALIGTCKMLKLGRNAGYIGPWRADIYGSGCIGWNKDETDLDDWILNMARACSMMALCFGCILAFFGFMNQCLCALPFTQKILDISGAGVQLSLALTWPMVRTSACNDFGGCTWDDGATALLIAQLLYFFASVFTRCMREPRYIRKKNEAAVAPPKQEDNKKAAEADAAADKKAAADAEAEQTAKEQVDKEIDAQATGQQLEA